MSTGKAGASAPGRGVEARSTNHSASGPVGAGGRAAGHPGISGGPADAAEAAVGVDAEVDAHRVLPPAQLNLLTGEPEPVRLDVAAREEGVEERIADGISMVKGELGETVILTGFGLYLGKKSERLTVRAPGGSVIYQFPFFRLQEVVVGSRGISLSSDLIEALCERGIRVAFLKGGRGGGEPFAMLQSAGLGATIKTRREQLEAARDERGLNLSRAIVEGKIRNQRALLLYFGKYLKTANPARFQVLAKAVAALKAQAAQARAVSGGNVDEARASLMGVEGVAGRLYWSAVAEVVKDRTTFLGREHRGATDEFNSLVNYGYGILYAQVWGAVVNAGLDPFGGFLHVDRPGKPSLVLDLVEEFRQPVVDRVVIARVNLGEPVHMSDGLLDVETRAGLADKVLARLDAREPFDGKRYQVRSIIQMQARRVAAFLRRETESYRCFRFKW
jgi:CRISPR-associated protein Cas1